MTAIRIIQWITGIAGLAALTLGLLYWIANIEFISLHMLLGLIVALGLLILGIFATTRRGMRILGVVSIVYALFVPVFGMTQSTLLIGDLHWLIRTAHLLVGLGALALMGKISTDYLRPRRPVANSSTRAQAVRS